MRQSHTALSHIHTHALADANPARVGVLCAHVNTRQTVSSMASSLDRRAPHAELADYIAAEAEKDRAAYAGDIDAADKDAALALVRQWNAAARRGADADCAFFDAHLAALTALPRGIVPAAERVDIGKTAFGPPLRKVLCNLADLLDSDAAAMAFVHACHDLLHGDDAARRQAEAHIRGVYETACCDGVLCSSLVLFTSALLAVMAGQPRSEMGMRRTSAALDAIMHLRTEAVDAAVAAGTVRKEVLERQWALGNAFFRTLPCLCELQECELMVATRLFHADAMDLSQFAELFTLRPEEVMEEAKIAVDEVMGTLEVAQHTLLRMLTTPALGHKRSVAVVAAMVKVNHLTRAARALVPASSAERARVSLRRVLSIFGALDEALHTCAVATDECEDNTDGAGAGRKARRAEGHVDTDAAAQSLRVREDDHDDA